MKHIYSVIACKWIDIQTFTNDKKGGFVEPAIAYSIGVHFCDYIHEGVKIMRLVTTIYKTTPKDVDDALDDYIDIPVGCIISTETLTKIDLCKKK